MACSLSLESVVPLRMFLGGTGAGPLGGQRARHVKGNIVWRLGGGLLEYDGPGFTILLCKLICSSVSLSLSYSSVKLGS